MAFKIPAKLLVSIADPESLFRDLRDRAVEGLLAQQADMLRKYMEHVDAHDIALELPTGSGKTLVGLLIAEWRRRTRQERCLLLSPTKQLVHQIFEQAKGKYGINTLDFSGSKHNYTAPDKSAFKNCEAIGIATYSAFFNTNTFFSDAHTLIFDDAHAAETYVSNLWSLEIHRSKDEMIFNAIWKIIEPYTTENEQLCYDQDTDGGIDTSFVNKIPTPYFLECKTALAIVLNDASRRGEKYEEYSYRWLMIKDHLHACHLYYTSNSILIRPLIPPTKSFKPFLDANQRIYMSATLGEGGDLERIFGRKTITRIPAPDGWDKQGIGRRFFVFPMRKWDDKDSLNFALSWISKFDRVLVLTQSNRDAEIVKQSIKQIEALKNHSIFDATELELSKKIFTQKDSAIAILANRYDGIDLIGDECRYLIVYGLPESTNLQERFIISRLGASVLFDVRIRTRITQAVGRCTRSSSDYALVVVIGEKANQYFHMPEKRAVLHPELQAEVNFGIEQSIVGDVCELEDNINSFIMHDSEWKSADNYILETRDKLKQLPISSASQLGKAVVSEVAFNDALWFGKFDVALSSAKDVLACLAGGHELKGYSALWNYLAGSAAYQEEEKDIAKEHFSAAFSCVSTLPWLRQIQKLTSNRLPQTPMIIMHEARIERIEHILEKFGKINSVKIERYFNSIRDGLSSTQSQPFEEAQVKIGLLLGFIAGKTENSGDPDPWWIIGKEGIVFEDYTATGEKPIISKEKTLQAKAHPDTLKKTHPHVNFSVVLCSTSRTLHYAAEPHTEGVYFIHKDEFCEFSEQCFKLIRSLWDTFQSSGNMRWREDAAEKIHSAGLENEDILSFLRNTQLASLVKG